jgi:hypothetical protein
MNNFSRVGVISLVMILLVCMLMMGGACNASDKMQSVFEQEISKKFVNSKLKDVLKSLSSETGILIVYDEQISQKNVSGNFKKVPLATVIKRLLSGVNHSLEMDLNRNTLFIKAFGKVKYVSTGIESGGAAGFLPNKDISYAELRALLDKQAQDYARQIADGKEYLEEFGMTRMEAKQQLNQQLEQFERESQDPDHFIDEVNMTVGQWRERQKKQQADFERAMNNDETLIDKGILLGEHRERMKEQDAAYSKQLKDDAEVMPEFGITRGEHRLMLTQQMEKFKQSLTD